MKIPYFATGLLALLALAACTDTGSIVARANGRDFPVDRTVALLIGEGFPNEPDVVQTVGEIWVDYFLLATAMAEDSTLAQLDLSRIVDQRVEQDLILALRDQLVRPDTLVSEEELAQRFAQVTPGARVRARHILLMPPDGATPAQLDSVRTLAERLLSRLRTGESFERLALDYSSDRASAVDGGDLGWFGHNELIPSLEAAAFALQAGEVSDVVESVVGLHLIRVDEREQPTLDETKDDVRAFVIAERTQVAESILITGIESGASIEVVDGAADLVRRIVENPGVKLSRRARSRPVVTFMGGAFTVGELITFIQSRADEFRFQIHNAPDEVIQQNLLVGLAQRKLLVQRALAEGLSVSVAEREALGQELRARLADAARELTLHGIPTREGESVMEARQLRVEAILQEMLREARDVMPLGSFSFILRERYSGIVYPTGVDEVVRRIADVRGPDTPGLPSMPGGVLEPLPDLNPSLPGAGALPPINPGATP